MSGEEKPTEILKREHQNVLLKLDSLEKVVSNLDKKEKIASELKELASFFKTDFWVHFAKEENALFPELERFIPREGGPTGVMLIEHEDLRSTNSKFQPAVEEYLKDSDSLEIKRRLQGYSDHFIGVLIEHIHKEDNILFTMADMHLDQDQRDKVVRLFQEIERAGRLEPSS